MNTRPTSSLSQFIQADEWEGLLPHLLEALMWFLLLCLVSKGTLQD